MSRYIPLLVAIFGPVIFIGLSYLSAKAVYDAPEDSFLESWFTFLSMALAVIAAATPIGIYLERDSL